MQFLDPGRSRNAELICLYGYSDDFRRSDGVGIRETFLKSTTPRKSGGEAGVGIQDDLFDINTPTIFAEAKWY